MGGLATGSAASPSESLNRLEPLCVIAADCFLTIWTYRNQGVSSSPALQQAAEFFSSVFHDHDGIDIGHAARVE